MVPFSSTGFYENRLLNPTQETRFFFPPPPLGGCERVSSRFRQWFLPSTIGCNSAYVKGIPLLSPSGGGRDGRSLGSRRLPGTKSPWILQTPPAYLSFRWSLSRFALSAIDLGPSARESCEKRLERQRVASPSLYISLQSFFFPPAGPRTLSGFSHEAQFFKEKTILSGSPPLRISFKGRNSFV